MAPKFFYHGILQRNYRKMTITWSFSYNSFVKLYLYNMIHLLQGSTNLALLKDRTAHHAHVTCIHSYPVGAYS